MSAQRLTLGHHSRSQHLGQHDAGFDVDHVVAGQHRHRPGAIRARRLAVSGSNVASPKITGTSSSRTADKNRLSSLISITATSYPAADQFGDHAHPERAQPDDDDVVAQMAHPRAS